LIIFPAVEIGVHQTLDIYHACEHIARAGKTLFGEGTPQATAFLERGRSLILQRFTIGLHTTRHVETTPRYPRR
jgi:hypothetical protein